MRVRLPVLALTAYALGCSPTPDPNAPIASALQALVDSVAAEAEIPGALLYVHAPAAGLEWSGAAGLSDVSTGTAMGPDQTFRNASNTKTYVAAAVLRLWEDGRLDLDEPVRGYLTPGQVAVLESDGYDLGSITLRHLLSHSSGLVDHGSADEYGAAINADPSHRWTRDEQIAGAVEWGDPLWPAGEGYAYSDTGYILLGQVIEEVKGQELGPAVRDLLGFYALGLEATWWEIMEPVPPTSGPRAHQYIGGVDSNAWDPSLDSYGGGGLVTSAQDLAAFWEGLFEGRVFASDATLDTMLTTPLPPEESPYRLGVFTRELDGRVVYEHSGFWGTRAVYVPELDLVVAGAVTEQTQGRAAFTLTDRAVQIVAAGIGTR